MLIGLKFSFLAVINEWTIWVWFNDLEGENTFGQMNERTKIFVNYLSIFFLFLHLWAAFLIIGMSAELPTRKTPSEKRQDQYQKVIEGSDFLIDPERLLGNSSQWSASLLIIWWFMHGSYAWMFRDIESELGLDEISTHFHGVLSEVMWAAERLREGSLTDCLLAFSLVFSGMEEVQGRISIDELQI